ncbi:short-chain dehydrogenase [Nonlabens sp. MB-3u-79]|uniref:SDR family NAD(P)-dependent oxidoreductase n=1 Tax=Nonlabens sp. MB-3u-79 TaxID=2058134 RepID=UPI000C31699A|nr:SDR family oxidoreductase [Nonlabens sp. MB-3u-79]AUC80300.1 short-chain dehydrogenase [Nonlabens sp. MB-3u-79]
MKTALITGASSGIGKDLAKIHASKGGDLIIVARSGDELRQLQSDLESAYQINVHVIVKDLTALNATQEIYDEVKAAGIPIDYLINNAGFGGIGKFYKRDWEIDQQMILLNIMALTHLCRLFIPDFVKRNEGKILNVSSTASLMPGPMQAIYFATKAYVTSLSNAIAQELSKTNITVTNLMPGATATGFGKVSGMDKTSLFDQTATSEEVAQTGYDAMINGDIDVKAGLCFSQKAMLAAIPLAPKKLLLKMIEKMQQPRE